MARRGYPLHVLHEYRMSAADVRATIKHIENTAPEDLRAQSGVSSARIALVPYAAEVLREVVKTFRPHDIAISSYGIREGLLYEQMPQPLRDRDPLIEACRFAEGALQFHPADLQIRGRGASAHRQGRLPAA
jgi:exopolyphosphatase/guanosine-5'-triphosphate,3'-diphosphate pyrophosphatase